MPVSMVEVDLARGTLVEIVRQDSPGIDILPMFAVYRADDPPGPGGTVADRPPPGRPGGGYAPLKDDRVAWTWCTIGLPLR